MSHLRQGKYRHSSDEGILYYHIQSGEGCLEFSSIFGCKNPSPVLCSVRDFSGLIIFGVDAVSDACGGLLPFKQEAYSLGALAMQLASDKLGRYICQDSSACSTNRVEDPMMMDGRCTYCSLHLLTKDLSLACININEHRLYNLS